jgi:hypothetical protein
MTTGNHYNFNALRIPVALKTKVTGIYVGGVATGINLSLALEQTKENLNWQFGIIGSLMCGSACFLSILKLPSKINEKHVIRKNLEL